MTPARLLWLDLETTGLNASHCRILEVGVILTDVGDHTLTPVFRESIVLDFPQYEDLDITQEPFKMHHESGLLEECYASNKSVIQAQDWLIGIIDEMNADGSPLCGSSIHFDREFLKQKMPQANGMLHYRNIDISTLKNLSAYQLWNIPEFERPKKAHRSLDDLDLTLEEARHYLRSL
jgi:oligoribonuclease